MITAAAHSIDCEWHHEQVAWECTCGAIADPEKFKPQWLKARPARPTEMSEEEIE